MDKSVVLQPSASSDCLKDQNQQCLPNTPADVQEQGRESTDGNAQESPTAGNLATTTIPDSGVDFTGTVGNGATSAWPEPTQSTPTQATTIIATEPSATATAEPTTQSSATTSTSNGSGVSSGAVAGIAIGALIVGAVAAFLAAMFLFRRRNRNRETDMGSAKGYSSYADSSPELVMMQQAKGAHLGGRNSPYVQVSQTPIPAPVSASVPFQHHQRRPSPSDVHVSFLPLPAHDDAIHTRVSAMFHSIHHHVETYYRDVHASITPSMESDLARFGATGTEMAHVLQDCSSPTTALKHALVTYVVGLTGPREMADDGNTLFPEELERTPVGSGDAKLSAAATLHRRLSVYLYTATSSPPPNARGSWAIQALVREAAEHFSLTFFPWANPASSEQDKDEDLARIISEALELRLWLYGQPYEYEFVWEGTGRRGILVSPGLVRNSEDDKRDWIVEGVIVGT